MSNNTGENAAHDDEFAADPIGGDDYDLALREAGAGIAPIALLPSAGDVALCDHTFELQSMRKTITALRAECERMALMLAALGYMSGNESVFPSPPWIVTSCPLPGERD